MRMVRLFLVVAIALAMAPSALAAKDLAVRAQKLEPLVLGSKESDYSMSVKEYRLETGKAYRWKVISYGLKEYALVAPRFFRNIWIRKVEVEDVEIKAAVIDELGFEDEGEAELFFVPIRTGIYEFRVRGLEEKGMVGRFIIE